MPCPSWTWFIGSFPPDTVENIFYSDTESECEIDDDVDEVYDSISDEPKLFTQSELNDLVRDLNLPKDWAEVFGFSANSHSYHRLKNEFIFTSGRNTCGLYLIISCRMNLFSHLAGTWSRIHITVQRTTYFHIW
ncbi:hypothetical protein AVEN_112420-1 [Araneus ventricosus]|uniref:Uncharacterized protein n=1 Tax=Araneus ventricosus TaxID=182803 RepID=A0A4Y2TGB1_ARAVE|nr:hypothetical protein AVEN_112420-1 [Araneus ventricosus]